MVVIAVASKDGISVNFDTEYVPKKSNFSHLLTGDEKSLIRKDSKGNIKTINTENELIVLKNYLEEGKINDVESLILLLDYYNIYTSEIPYFEEFIKIKLREDWFRHNLYNPYFNKTSIQDNDFRLILWDKIPDDIFTLAAHLPFLNYKIEKNVYGQYDNDNFNTILKRHNSIVNQMTILNNTIYNIIGYRLKSYFRTPNYILNNITEEEINDKTRITEELFDIRNQEYNNELLYAKSPKTVYNSQEPFNIYDNINQHDNFYINPMYQHVLPSNFNWNNVVIAGGSVLKSVLKIQNRNDIDIFIFGLNSSSEYTDKLWEIIKSLGDIHRLSITNHSVSFIVKKRKYQVILRAYKTKSEIIHGFDVDSSCILYDGKQFLVTERFVYAIKNMVNTIDYDRMSPSYEYRLRKYNKLGFSIHIPDFDVSKVHNLNDYIKSLSDIKLYWYKLFNDADNFNRSKFIKYSKIYNDELNKLLKSQGIDFLIGLFMDIWLRNKYQMSDYSYNEYNDPNYFQERYWVDNRYELTKYNTLHGDNMPSHPDRSFDFISDGFFSYITKKNHDNSYLYILIPRIINVNTRFRHFKHANLYINYTYYIDLVHNLEIPIKWKVVNPGEQFTGTFHQTVHDNYRNWYQGKYYPIPE